MTLRSSVSDPNQPSATAIPDSKTSDYESGDSTPGPLWSIAAFFVKTWWLWTVIVCLAALSFPYLFPHWADNYKKELSELGVAGNTARFVRNAQDVDWKKAFSNMNIRYLKLVGTGKHPEFQKTPGLKEGAWYTGQGFIMKSYVTERDFIKHETGEIVDPVPDSLLPATEIEQGDAAEYCQAQGGRLPTWEELSFAAWFAFTKSWQGATGNWLKPNLEFKITPEYSLWTSSPEGKSFLTRDNFRVFTKGKKDSLFIDDGDESSKIGFLCIKDEAKK